MSITRRSCLERVRCGTYRAACRSRARRATPGPCAPVPSQNIIAKPSEPISYKPAYVLCIEGSRKRVPRCGWCAGRGAACRRRRRPQPGARRATAAAPPCTAGARPARGTATPTRPPTPRPPGSRPQTADRSRRDRELIFPDQGSISFNIHTPCSTHQTAPPANLSKARDSPRTAPGRR